MNTHGKWRTRNLVGLAIAFGAGLTGNQYFPHKNTVWNPVLGGTVLWFQPNAVDLVMIGLAYLVLSYQALGIANAQLGPLPGFIFMGSLIVIGLLIYFVARAVRAAQGINLDLIYSELPPE